MNRRHFVKLGSATALSLPAISSLAAPASTSMLPGKVIPLEPGTTDISALKLNATWHADLCTPTLTNTGASPVRIREIVLFDLHHTLPPETALYGESFQMLSQFTGTLAKPVALGLSDEKHYRIPQPADATTITSLLTLSPPGAPHRLLAFTSCKSFIGRFYLRPGSIQAVVDTEGLAIAPGETWHLEQLLQVTGPDRHRLLDRLVTAIQANHPSLPFPKEPTGWCSYYCFGTKATTEQVYGNLDVIARDIPQLRYVQIDDGYQPAMGDWLEPGKAFGGNISAVLAQIRNRGFEPAIWVAPFIAGKNSRVLAEHPAWFMHNAQGEPTPAADVTFTGWGGGGWYSLDGTHPEVQQHLEHVFRVMREQWGCTYFKLDANFWGTMHGARLHDPRATRIEAYRRGMEAIRRGAGDAFILGCNHPIWPSLGLIHGSRSSGDIKRTWPNFAARAQETLGRNWQNGRLWWNDPDAVLLTGNLSLDEYRYHATAAFASGGLILSGDDLTAIPSDRLAMLRKLLPPRNAAAIFDDHTTLEIGRTRIGQELWISAFNRSDQPKSLSVPLPRRAHITELWSGTDLGEHTRSIELANMPPHSASLLRCV